MIGRLQLRLGVAGIVMLSVLATTAPAFADEFHEWGADAPASVELPVRDAPSGIAIDAPAVTHEFEGANVFRAGQPCSLPAGAFEMDAVLDGNHCVRSTNIGVVEAVSSADFERETFLVPAGPATGATLSPSVILGDGVMTATALVDR